jgi:hypothetical protein
MGALGVIAAGSAISAGGSIASGIMASQQAANAIRTSALEEQRFRRSARRRAGLARAQFGALGITSEGSPLEVLADQAAEQEEDAMLIRFGGQVRKAESKARSGVFASEKSASLLAGGIGASTALLRGAERIML